MSGLADTWITPHKPKSPPEEANLADVSIFDGFFSVVFLRRKMNP